MRAGRLVHDGTIRRVSGGLSPRDGSVPNNAATAEAFFLFVASRMSSSVDSSGLLSDYRSIIGVDPDDSAASKGLSAAEYAALKKVAGDGATGECAVCMIAFQPGAESRQLPCHHIFCETCTKRWMDQHTTCPMCRRDCRFVDLKALAEQGRLQRVQRQLWSPPEPSAPRTPTAPRPPAVVSTGASPRSRPAGVQRASPATSRAATSRAVPPTVASSSLHSPRRRRQQHSHAAEQASASRVPSLTQSAPPPARRPQPSPRGAQVRLSAAAAAAAASATRERDEGGGGLAARTPRRIYQTRPPSPRVPGAGGTLGLQAAHRQRGGPPSPPLRVVARATTPPGVRLPRF